MLVEEARDVGGFTFAELDTLLDFEEGTASRYAQRKRAPNAEDIQDLENKVARVLKRTAHLVVIEDNGLAADGPFADRAVGVPDKNLNLRGTPADAFQLGYEDDWPTYRRLKYSPRRGGQTLLSLYAWQWGLLWDRGVLQAPWTRESMGLDPSTPVEEFLPHMVSAAKAERSAYMSMRRSLTSRAHE